MRQTTKIMLILAMMAATLSCGREEEQKPEIKVAKDSQSIIASGINLEAAEDPGSPEAGHVQTVLFRFTTTDKWSATVEATKTSSWITLEPFSGPAGDVTMSVIVQDNTEAEARSAVVTVKCGDETEQFTVTQAGAPPKVIEVIGIALDRTEVTMEKNESITLVAEVTPSDATNPTVGWSSSDESVATVDQDGKVTAIGAGIATIKATSGNVSATCTVTVKAAYVFSIDPGSVNIPEEGGLFDVAVTCTEGSHHISSMPDWIVEKSVKNNVHTFEASKNSTTDERQGVIVFCDDYGTCIPCEVKQYAASVISVTSIKLNKTSLNLEKGGTETLTATVNPADATDKSVTWSSSDSAVASVDQSGKVTAMKGGSATITAKAGEKTATCVVTVTVPVESVSLNRTTMALEEGKSETLTATVSPSDATDKTVTWTTSNSAVAQVEQNGRVTALKEGSAVITVSVGDKSASCAVTVQKKVIPVTSVTLDKASLTLAKGASATLVATVNPADATDKSVTWSSSDATVASVDQSGKVTALKGGSVTITAKAGEKTATCAVTVIVPVESVSLSRTTITLEEGQSETLTATVNPADATDKSVTWSSSDSSVASVDQSGKVTAVRSGSAVITANAGGKSATCTVTVNKKIVSVTSIKLNKTSLTLEMGKTETLMATVLPDNATNKNVTWSSSDESVATVSTSGVVTAVAPGTAVITVTTADGSKTASCSVTVQQPTFNAGDIEGTEDDSWN